MLPKNGQSVEIKYFLYSIIKIYNVNYYLRHRKNIFCNLTIFELVNEIGDFESLWIYGRGMVLTLIGTSYKSKKDTHLQRHLRAFLISLAGKQIKPIYVNFGLKTIEIFDKKSADKI